MSSDSVLQSVLATIGKLADGELSPEDAEHHIIPLLGDSGTPAAVLEVLVREPFAVHHVLRSSFVDDSLLRRVVADDASDYDDWTVDVLVGCHPNTQSDTLAALLGRVTDACPTTDDLAYYLTSGVFAVQDGPIQALVAVAVHRSATRDIRDTAMNLLTEAAALAGGAACFDKTLKDDVIELLEFHSTLDSDDYRRVMRWLGAG